MSLAIPCVSVLIFACARQMLTMDNIVTIKNITVVREIVASITTAPSCLFLFIRLPPAISSAASRRRARRHFLTYTL